jgi:nickel-dependent lactate racemase
MPKEEITVLVATGLHRPNEGDELSELVGSELGHGEHTGGKPLCPQ